HSKGPLHAHTDRHRGCRPAGGRHRLCTVVVRQHVRLIAFDVLRLLDVPGLVGHHEKLPYQPFDQAAVTSSLDALQEEQHDVAYDGRIDGQLQRLDGQQRLDGIVGHDVEVEVEVFCPKRPPLRGGFFYLENPDIEGLELHRRTVVVRL